MRPNDDARVAETPRGTIFLVRAWTEHKQFRARIRCSIEISSPTHACRSGTRSRGRTSTPRRMDRRTGRAKTGLVANSTPSGTPARARRRGSSVQDFGRHSMPSIRACPRAVEPARPESSRRSQPLDAADIVSWRAACGSCGWRGNALLAPATPTDSSTARRGSQPARRVVSLLAPQRHSPMDRSRHR